MWFWFWHKKTQAAISLLQKKRKEKKSLWPHNRLLFVTIYRFIHWRRVVRWSLTFFRKSGVLAASQPAVICNAVDFIRPDQPFLLLVLLTDLLLPPSPPSPNPYLIPHTAVATHMHAHAHWTSIFAPPIRALDTLVTNKDEANLLSEESQSVRTRPPTYSLMQANPPATPTPPLPSVRPSVLPLKCVIEEDNRIKGGNPGS